jgi:hypothetical protein
MIDDIVHPGIYDIGNGRSLHVFLTGTEELGHTLWACSAYDHGPLCRLCQPVDATLNGCLQNVLDGRMECRQDQNGGFKFKVTQAGIDAVRTMVKRYDSEEDELERGE